ncbi:MAG: 30S ribosomal protein S6 [Phycisphaeraceae bacterium]|nr:30S ribosomal protein S6 [Phycisphaeraceae bacterium]
MSDAKNKRYEGLFLVDQTSGAEIEEVIAHVQEILERAEAEIEVLTQWAERQLAYPIRGQRRGVYLLAYFLCRGTQVPNIERDVRLSDHLLRALVTRADHIGDEELQAAKEGRLQELINDQAEEEDVDGDEDGGDEEEASTDASSDESEEAAEETAEETEEAADDTEEQPEAEASDEDESDTADEAEEEEAEKTEAAG